jgi:hypothetical protein
MEVGRFLIFFLVGETIKYQKKLKMKKFVYSNGPDSPKVGDGWMDGWIDG